MLACADYCAQPWPYHISFCGDLDIVGGQKPQAFLRRVLWNNSKLEMAVHMLRHDRAAHPCLARLYRRHHALKQIALTPGEGQSQGESWG